MDACSLFFLSLRLPAAAAVGRTLLVSATLVKEDEDDGVLDAVVAGCSGSPAPAAVGVTTAATAAFEAIA